MNLEILVETVGGNRLTEDYARGEGALAPFFPGHPFDLAAYRRKAEEVRRRLTPDALASMADAVTTTTPGAAEKLAAIADGRGFMVTTGQQPGLFTGPLYTVYKALSAVALAAELEARLDQPVLALFWVASDDHDWDEANHTWVLGTDNTPRRLELPGDGDGAALSMGHRRLEEAAETTLGELRDLLPPSDFTPTLLDRLEGAYRDGTVASAFAATLKGLLADLPLGFVDAQDPTLRRLAVPVLRRELENAAAHEAALRGQTERLEALGYEAQVPILPGAANVFLEDGEQGRERLLREDGAWVLRASRRRLTDAELRERFEREPGAFSPNVVLRPVVESAVFPTLAYVGGPGEVRYLAQTGCLFEAHGVGMPVVFPRHGVTLVEGKVRKVLDKFGLEVGAFGRPLHEVVADVVREDVPESVREALGSLRRSLQQGYQEVYDAAESIDPTLKGPIFGARNEAFKALSEVEKKIRQHVKAKEETELEQLGKAAANLRPEGKPQERVLNVHHFLARYGPALIPAVLDRLEVRLDRDEPGWTGVGCA